MVKTCTVLLSNSLGRWQEPGETRVACVSKQTVMDTPQKFPVPGIVSELIITGQSGGAGANGTHIQWIQCVSALTAHYCSCILFCSAFRDWLCSLYTSFTVALVLAQKYWELPNRKRHSRKKKMHSDHISELHSICCIGVVISSTPFYFGKCLL